MIDFDMYVPPLFFHCNALVLDDLSYCVSNAHFCHAILFVHAMPLIVVSLFRKPVYDHYHQVYFRCQTISLPWHPAFVFACGHLKHFLVVVEASLTREQKALPFILCNCGHHFLKATWMNDILTLQTITCLQGFILS